MNSKKTLLTSAIWLFSLWTTILKADDFPYEIQLREDTIFPIIENGKALGSIKATNGTTVVALSLSNNFVEVRYKEFTNIITSDKTNLEEVMAAEKKEEDERKLKRAEKEKAQRDTLLAKQQQKESIEQETLFKNAQRGVRVLKKYINSYPHEEQVVLQDVIRLDEKFVSDYQNATPDNRSIIANEFKRKGQEQLSSRPIYGLRYNEFLHKDTVTPVNFNIYKNNDGLYIQVGEGDFCTVADIPPDEFGKIMEAANTFVRWSNQCIDDNMNAEKELYKSRSITMEFVSQDNADKQFVRISVAGPFSKQSLLASQDIIMTKMNFFALINKMSKAGKMLQDSLNLKNNADKLN